MNRKVCITRRFPGDWEERLRSAGCEIVAPAEGVDAVMPREEFLEKIPGCAAVICPLTERWDAEAFDAAGAGLRVVANYAVGFNNVDLVEATRRGVAVTNTPDVLTEATADAAWGGLMMAARRLGEGERNVRAGRFTSWGPSDYLGLDLNGKIIGIIGAGRIGTAIAWRSRGWNMEVIYCGRRRHERFELSTDARYVSLEDLLSRADFISISVPLSEETRHMIGERELSMMKKTAVLVNTSRGAVIDEKALVEALRERRIFAAALDVYENEPELAPGLVELENAVLLPHLGSATFGARCGMTSLCVDNVLAVLDGQVPPNLVNTEWHP